jgi:hypothetical protein
MFFDFCTQGEVHIAEKGDIRPLPQAALLLGRAQCALGDNTFGVVVFSKGGDYPESGEHDGDEVVTSKPLQFIDGLSLAEIETDSLLPGGVMHDADDFVLVFGWDVEEGAVLHNFAHEEESYAAADELQAKHAHQDLILPKGDALLPVVLLYLSGRRRTIAAGYRPLAVSTATDADASEFMIEEDVTREDRSGVLKVGKADIYETVSKWVAVYAERGRSPSKIYAVW